MQNAYNYTGYILSLVRRGLSSFCLNLELVVIAFPVLEGTQLFRKEDG